MFKVLITTIYSTLNESIKEPAGGIHSVVVEFHHRDKALEAIAQIEKSDHSSDGKPRNNFRQYVTPLFYV